MTRHMRAPPAFIATADRAVIQGGEPGSDPSLPGRSRFLMAVEREAPEVLDTLLEQVFPAYRRALRHERRFILNHPGEIYPQAETPEWQEAERTLLRWAGSHSLDTAWVHQAALWTMLSWDDDHGRLGRSPEPRWRWPGRIYIDTSVAVFRFQHEEGWLLGLETKDEAAEKIRRSFEKELRLYLDHVAALAKEAGYPEPRQRRGIRGRVQTPDHDRHYRWLTLWQVCGQSKRDIAKAAAVSQRAVSIALRSTAEEITLPLRRSPRLTIPQRKHRRGPQHHRKKGR